MPLDKMFVQFVVAKSCILYDLATDIGFDNVPDDVINYMMDIAIPVDHISQGAVTCMVIQS